MRSALRVLGCLSSSLVLLVACGDDGGSSAAGTDSATDTDAASTGTTTSPTTADDADTTSVDATAGTEADTDTSTGTADDSESGEDDTGTDTDAFDCASIPSGPFDATPVFDQPPFSGSEDIAFDGQGNLVGRDGQEVAVVDADGRATALAQLQTPTYGVRYRRNGDLLLAAFQAQRILRITPQGDVSDFASNVGGVNGLYPDFDDNVWFTNFQSVERIDAQGNRDVIVSGAAASGANGIVFDPDRSILFFTGYNAGEIRSVEIDANGDPGQSSTVTTILGTAPDGLALDVCGNLYVVDQQGEQIYRVFLDDRGAAIGDAEALLADPTPTNIANAQFGAGPGWNADSLYAAGNPGTVYEIPVGVPGAPYPLPR